MSEKRTDYRQQAQTLGKKEFTLLKMQEYGFWPKHLPTPYEKQASETPEQYNERKKLLAEYDKIIRQIDELYKEKDDINRKLSQLKKEYDQTWDYEKIRQDVAQKIMQESIARRAQKKQERRLAKEQKTLAWQKKKAENILFIGKGFSNALHDKETDQTKLQNLQMPVITDDKQLTEFLAIDYKQLRYLVYHRDVVTFDNYHRYTLAKAKGGERNIAAPKAILKNAQRKILEEILYKISPSQHTHGFLVQKSVITNAQAHQTNPELLLTMDMQDFFPTVTFARVKGMFKNFGYSGYTASLLAMICTYCERMPIEVRGITRYVKTSERILPQGAPTSPMITNILCLKLDKRLSALAKKYNATYTRYADDMSFSFMSAPDTTVIGKFMGMVCSITKDEGFNINNNKTRFLRSNNCQCITGIVVNNEQIGVTKNWLKTFRAAIYNLNKLKTAGNPLPSDKINEISGMASWLQSVNPNRYAKIIEQATQVLKN